MAVMFGLDVGVIVGLSIANCVCLGMRVMGGELWRPVFGAHGR